MVDDSVTSERVRYFSTAFLILYRSIGRIRIEISAFEDWYDMFLHNDERHCFSLKKVHHFGEV